MEPLPAIPGYELLQPLGRGSYSQVYLARTPAHGRGWAFRAIKILKAELETDPWVLQCFRREGVIGAAIRHPSLVAMDSGDELYHVCEWIDGQTLRDAALLPLPVVIAVMAQIADALSALHREDYVHGDVKPGNIMLEPNGRAVLIDLGFARQPGTLPFGDGLPGTPNYLAPELCRRTFVDTAAADVFALGVTAYELLTGEVPYPKLDDSREVLRQHRDERPASLKVFHYPQWLAELVNGMLEYDLFSRPKMSQIVKALTPAFQKVA
jgi:serine/threonine-protein kinase